MWTEWKGDVLRSSVRTEKTMTGSNGAEEGRLKIYFKEGCESAGGDKKRAVWHRALGRKAELKVGGEGGREGGRRK